ncbi:hypothetical protein Bca52824_046392 [Brassica carinata]|uniref:Neprosin activation peptide domain-containing protein n=1 Tax=Brassica carinata TaxID=52824 RepID=A0A8X7RH30_BRACI|nr:hypothetical protein Bca52824_046392 [Brassica carinata]
MISSPVENSIIVSLIRAPDGDVTACVPITKQPASDHLFLKNHKIHMKPNYYPEGFFDDNKVSSTKSGKERHTYPSVMTSVW